MSLSIKREVLSEGLDGLIEDTKFSGVAKEGRYYTEEGIYTVTVENLATGDSVEKRVYVGDSDILKTHMITGISISEINERLATGAVIDENGYISDYVSETNEEDIKTESEETTEIESGTEEISDAEKDTEKIDKVVNDEQQKNKNDGWILPAVIAILVVLGITLVLRKKKKNNTDKKEADAE